MTTINPISVSRAVESFTRDKISLSLSDVALGVFGRVPGQLSRAEFGLTIYALKAAGWKQRKDFRTGAKFWRAPQQAAQEPISAQGDTYATLDDEASPPVA